MINKIRNQICTVFLLLSIITFAQHPNDELKISSSTTVSKLLIGDQFQLKIVVQNPGKTLISFPSQQTNVDSLKQVEIISSTIDTLFDENKNVKSLEQHLTLTSFEEGQHEISGLTVLYQYPNDTTIHTHNVQPFFITVSTMKVDTTKALKAIKDIEKEPLTFKEILPYILIGLGILLLVFVVYYVIKRYKENKPLLPLPVKPALPAHQIALNELETLRLKKLWQNDRIKEYYTELTDILRKYMLARFGVHAIEMTSDEIIGSLKSVQELTPKLIEKVNLAFTTADLAKFAKSKPLSDEHDACFRTAVQFVEETIPQTQEKQPAEIVINNTEPKIN